MPAPRASLADIAGVWRSATSARDDDAIVGMSLSLYVEDPGSRVVRASDVRRTLTRLRAEPARGLAVVCDIVDPDGCACIDGFALLCSFWSNELGGEVCTVDELYVGAAHRSRGLGSGLIRLLVQGRVPRFRDAVALELEVTPTNRRAHALYERLGFRSRKNTTLRLRR